MEGSMQTDQMLKGYLEGCTVVQHGVPLSLYMNAAFFKL